MQLKLQQGYSENLLLAGEGAEEFAREMNLEFVKSDYYFSQEQYEQWQHRMKSVVSQENSEHGTVGAVALDNEGNLAVQLLQPGD